MSGCPVGDDDRCGDQTPCADCPAAFCQWAACSRPSAKHEDGWHHCDKHLVEHRALTDGEPEDIPGRIAYLHGLGYGDRQIAAEVGLTHGTVTYRRRRMGLTANNPQRTDLLPHGTTAAARRHYRRREPLCEECLQAQRVAHAERSGGSTYRASVSGERRWIS